jgi:U3 small nucleolar RNA-associated protein 7
MRVLTSSCFLAVLGPYTLEYTSNGRYMIVGGRKGHIAMMDMLNMDLIKEFQVSFQYP